MSTAHSYTKEQAAAASPSVLCSCPRWCSTLFKWLEAGCSSRGDMKPLHPSHCSLLWSHTSPGDWCSNTTMRYHLSVLSLAPFVLSAQIMGSVLFSKQTCQQSTPLQHSSSPKASAPNSAAIIEFCVAAWGKFCPALVEGAEPSLLSHSFQFGSSQSISRSILPAIFLMKFPFLFFLPSVSSYHTLTMHWTELLLISWRTICIHTIVRMGWSILVCTCQTGIHQDCETEQNPIAVMGLLNPLWQYSYMPLQPHV